MNTHGVVRLVENLAEHRIRPLTVKRLVVADHLPHVLVVHRFSEAARRMAVGARADKRDLLGLVSARRAEGVLARGADPHAVADFEPASQRVDALHRRRAQRALRVCGTSYSPAPSSFTMMLEHMQTQVSSLHRCNEQFTRRQATYTNHEEGIALCLVLFIVQSKFHVIGVHLRRHFLGGAQQDGLVAAALQPALVCLDGTDIVHI